MAGRNCLPALSLGKECQGGPDARQGALYSPSERHASAPHDTEGSEFRALDEEANNVKMSGIIFESYWQGYQEGAKQQTRVRKGAAMDCRESQLLDSWYNAGFATGSLSCN